MSSGRPGCKILIITSGLSALEQAEITVQKHETMTLKAKNSRIFFETLAAPIRFNRKLAAALEEHDQRVVSK
jgi:uncharacterized protein (DUF1778 family)